MNQTKGSLNKLTAQPAQQKPDIPVRMLYCLILGLLLIQAVPMQSAAQEKHIRQVDLDFSQQAVERGAKAYRTMCLTCHSLKTLNLKASLSPKQVERQLDVPAKDLSLITKARGKNLSGAQYVFTLLTGYVDNDNVAYPGLRMPDPGTDRQTAQDIAVFLNHIADPNALYRRALGRYVLGFLAILAVLLWVIYKDTWKDIK